MRKIFIFAVAYIIEAESALAQMEYPCSKSGKFNGKKKDRRSEWSHSIIWCGFLFIIFLFLGLPEPTAGEWIEKVHTFFFSRRY